MEFLNYPLLEHFKDGHVFSSKYESRNKEAKTPHVLVFSNQEPDRSKLSQDRWNIHQILSLTRDSVV